jgi:hypothetical protein
LPARASSAHWASASPGAYVVSEMHSFRPVRCCRRFMRAVIRRIGFAGRRRENREGERTVTTGIPMSDKSFLHSSLCSLVTRTCLLASLSMSSAVPEPRDQHPSPLDSASHILEHQRDHSQLDSSPKRRSWRVEPRGETFALDPTHPSLSLRPRPPWLPVSERTVSRATAAQRISSVLFGRRRSVLRFHTP